MSGYSFAAPPAPAGSEKQQLQAMFSYLYRMNENLNVALNNLSGANFAQETRERIERATGSTEQKDALQGQYDALKSLVIKTADIVRQEMTMIVTQLDGKYLAISEFGQYQENMEATIRATAEGIIQEYGFESKLDDLSNSASEFDEYKVKTDQYIKTGLLYYDGSVPRYGVAVGENLTTVEVDGEQILERNNLCATFTSDRLSFWMGGVEVAYVSNNKLYIANVEITGQMIMGNWRLSFENGFQIQWIGG